MVSELVPPAGPTTGGTAVTVLGQDFIASDRLRCRFGAVPVPATYLSAGALVCESPATAAGNVSLEVSNNDQVYTANTLAFLFYGAWLVDGVDGS